MNCMGSRRLSASSSPRSFLLHVTVYLSSGKGDTHSGVCLMLVGLFLLFILLLANVALVLVNS